MVKRDLKYRVQSFTDNNFEGVASWGESGSRSTLEGARSLVRTIARQSKGKALGTPVKIEERGLFGWTDIEHYPKGWRA